MAGAHDRLLDRREVLGWMARATAAMSVLDLQRAGGGTPSPAPPPASGVEAAAGPALRADGYGTDPDINRMYEPGAFWELTLDESQRRTVTVLCDVILPADDRSPAASEVRVPLFIDEWVSAPYPAQEKDRELMNEGLAWLDTQADQRFGKSFAELSDVQHREICDDICSAERAAPEHEAAAKFFGRFRTLTMGAFYSSPAGMRDIGYVGNVPKQSFEGPPPEVLRKVLGE
ncbi:MAG: gluconate 2-dehydrogenase subunit 3 family protein [Planctomycetota bacterium]